MLESMDCMPTKALSVALEEATEASERASALPPAKVGFVSLGCPGPSLAFSVQYPRIASRRRGSCRPGPLLTRKLGRRHCRSTQLSLRRGHATRSCHAAPYSIHQDCRGLRSSLQLLHHSPV